MFEAFMSLLKHADWPKAANLAEAQDQLVSLSIDNTECSEFRNSISDSVQQIADIDKIESTLEVVATLLNTATDRKFEEMMAEIHKALENPWIIGSG